MITQEKISNYNKIFEDIAEYLPQIVWTAKPDGTVDYYNQRWKEFTGFTQEKGLGSGWKIVLHPEDEAKTIKAWKRSVKTGKPYEIEHRIKCSDGSYKWVLSKGIPRKNKKGKILKWYGSATDIDERKEAEGKLKESIKRFRLMGETIPYGVWSTDAEGNADYISASFLEMVGMSLDQAKEHGWINCLLPATREETIEKWQECVKTGKDWEREHFIISKDDQVKIILARGKPIRNDEDNITGWVGINLDITERKKVYDELIKSLNENKLLMKEVVHRTKNNLQLVVSLINLQIENNTNDEIVEVLKLTQSRIKSVALLHERLNEINSINFINTTDYLPKLVSIIEKIYSEKSQNIKINKKIESIEVPIKFAINLGLILNEIVTNSFKYAYPDKEDGLINIAVEKNKSGDKILLNIKDNGVGFKKKSQRSNSIGLQLIESLIYQYSGEININSEQGTNFKISFPLSEI